MMQPTIATACECGDCTTHGQAIIFDHGTWRETVIIGTRGAHVTLSHDYGDCVEYAKTVAKLYGWENPYQKPLHKFLEECEDIAYYHIGDIRRLYA